MERPIATGDGTSGARERRWGLIGGVLGVSVGVGSALIAVLVEGAPGLESVPYPRFFARRQLLAYDLFIALVLAVGAFFAIAAVVLARRSRFPRTDASGAGTAGAILLLLGAAILFTRLIAVIRGA